MKRNSNKVLVILSVVIFVSMLIMFCLVLMNYWPRWFGLEKWEIYASVNVTDGGGFDLNSTAMTFGRIKMFGSSSRAVNFTNEYNFPVLVEISADGNIAPLLAYITPVFVKEGEIMRIVVSALAKNGTLFGFYEGHVNFKVMPA